MDNNVSAELAGQERPASASRQLESLRIQSKIKWTLHPAFLNKGRVHPILMLSYCFVINSYGL
jgi:hypothetical protein